VKQWRKADSHPASMGGVRPEWLAATPGGVRWIGIAFVESSCTQTARRADPAAEHKGDTQLSWDL